MNILETDSYYDGSSTTPVRTEYRYTVGDQLTNYPYPNGTGLYGSISIHYHCPGCGIALWHAGLCDSCADHPIPAMRAEDV